MPTVLRMPAWQRLIHVLALGATPALLIAGAVDTGGWVVAPCLIGAAVLLPATVRCWFLRVEADSAGLVVVNWLRTMRLPWPSVARCGYDGSGVWIRRNDGNEVRPSAFQFGTRALGFARTPAIRAAARLEKLRVSARRRKRPPR